MLQDLHQRILINLKLLEQQGRKKCTFKCILKKNYHSHVDPWPHEGIDHAIFELKNLGLIEHSQNLKLTPKGSKEATYVFERFLAKTMIQSMGSETLHRFRETLYGTDLFQYNITTRHQFMALKNFICPGPEKTLLDLGCGLGGTAQYLAGFGAKVHGIDLVQELIEYNQNRLSTFPTLALSFETANIAKYTPPQNTFDAIYSIDAFQFLTLDELTETLPKLYEALKKDGTLVILYSQLITQTEQTSKPSLASPDALLIGQALRRLKLPYTSIDFSDEYLPFWQRSAKIAESLKTEFADEGFAWFYEERLHESERILKETLTGNNAFGRYLYRVSRD